MKKIIIVLLTFTLLTITSCKEDYNKIKDFKKFFNVFKDTVKNKDKVMLDKLLSKDIHYTVGDKRDKYTRKEIIDTFDFDMTMKILREGYYLNSNVKSADCPPHNNNFDKYDYILRFADRGNGWKLEWMDKLY